MSKSKTITRPNTIKWASSTDTDWGVTIKAILINHRGNVRSLGSAAVRAVFAISESISSSLMSERSGSVTSGSEKVTSETYQNSVSTQDCSTFTLNPEPGECEKAFLVT